MGYVRSRTPLGHAKRAARHKARHMGHHLDHWYAHTATWFEASCEDCGRTVQVKELPSTNTIQTGGYAIDFRCD